MNAVNGAMDFLFQCTMLYTMELVIRSLVNLVFWSAILLAILSAMAGIVRRAR